MADSKKMGSQFGIHISDTIPVQVIATDTRGEDNLIGDFPGGVVLKYQELLDVKTHTIIASYSQRQRMWIIRGKPYPYVFMQVKPRD